MVIVRLLGTDRIVLKVSRNDIIRVQDDLFIGLDTEGGHGLGHIAKRPGSIDG